MNEDELSERGRMSFQWAKSHMPVLLLAEQYVRKKMSKRQFESLNLAACLHVSKETSVLINSLNSLGLNIRLVAANPLSSQDEISSFLSRIGIDVHAKRGESVTEYKSEIYDAANSRPDLIVDDGGDLHVAYSRTRSNSCFGGTEETTSGATRLAALERGSKLRYPAIPVNDAKTKHLFDNRYGTGQSAIDGLIRSTGLLLAGKTLVVSGYGWVGKGVSERGRGLGARVIITEVDPIRGLEAKLDGFEVLRMKEAAEVGDIFLTCTGQINIINSAHFGLFKDGAILGNVGHFNQEIDTRALLRRGIFGEQVRNGVAKITMPNSKSIFLIDQGRVVNLISAEGHPPEIMQLSFANQLLSIYYLVSHRTELARSQKRLLDFPESIDELVAKFAMQGFGLQIDSLTRKQIQYAGSFKRGSA